MTAREALTAALHAHTCHPDGEACAWAGEDYPGDGTCADVGEVGIEDAVLAWAATRLADDVEWAIKAARPHVPPSTDRNRTRNLAARIAYNHAARIARRALGAPGRLS